MNSTHQEALRRPQPALVVKSGNAERRTLPLDRDGITLGRARGCDIELNAPEVSALHCLITRGPQGLYLRDCKSRGGTRLNGERIHEALLRDGDVLQVGPFSFDVHLPGVYLPPPDRAATKAMGKARTHHLTRSRRHLAELALELRRRLREKEKDAPDEQLWQELDDQRAGLERLAEKLKERVRLYEQKAMALEEAERCLAADRELLTREQESMKARAQEFEQRYSKPNAYHG